MTNPTELMSDPAWTPHKRHGQAGYAFEQIPGFAIFLSEPYVDGPSVDVKILSAGKGMCLSEATFPPDGCTDDYADILSAARWFALLHAAEYFQDQAEKCLKLYMEPDGPEEGGRA